MTSRDFFYLVSNMRSAQINYFKTRDQSYLRAARRLETEVDGEISRVKNLFKTVSNGANKS